VCGLSSFLLYKFSSKGDNSTLVRTIAFIGWFCGLSTLAVLRVDIAITSKTIEKTEAVDNNMRRFWRTFYWSNFSLSHIIIPTLMQYERSGHSTPKERLSYAVK
jgi:hypothetical protein